MIKWFDLLTDLQTAALNQLISRRTTKRVLWNPIEKNNSNKIIIIKTIIVGFMIKKQQHAIQNYFSYFQPKHMV